MERNVSLVAHQFFVILTSKMAPWRDQGSESKVPDKDAKTESLETPKVEQEETTETTPASRQEQAAKQPEEKEVLTLDEGQLKALLDEAITYKNPKDREGKSELFKELLQEVEADESESKGLGSSLSAKLHRGSYNLPARRRHTRHQGRECGVGVSTTRGGSLQNLHALGMGGGRRRSGRSGEPLVSARQREGGSLPTNVNADNDTDLDGIIPNYTSRATLEVSGSCKEDNGSVKESNDSAPYQGNCPTGAAEASQLSSARSPGLSSTKDDEGDNKFASIISVSPLDSGAMLYPPNTSVPQQHVSMFNIPPPQINIGPDEHRIWDSTDHKKGYVSRRGHQKAVTPSVAQVDSQDSANKGLLGLPFLAHWNRYSSFTFLDFRDPSSRMPSFGRDPDPKATVRSWDVDQNQNSVGCLRMDSNCMDRKKQRRVKTKNDRNYILAENIEGFRGDTDIDTLMEYIESPSNILDINKAPKARTNQSNGPRNHCKLRAKEEDSRPIKRRTKEKFQRCNSLEEISKTKLEDLTEESSSERVNGSQQTLSKVPVTLDDTQLESTWRDEGELQVEESSAVMKRNKEQKKERTSPDSIQDSEFHVVTKKQRKKKRRSGCGGRVGSKQTYYSRGDFPAHDRTLEQDGTSGLLYQYRGRADKVSSQQRRKSASSVPPSDKSNDSSDLDSVHSLPVSSTTSRTKVGKNSVSGGSTPQASYADIARTIASPADIVHGKYSPYLLSSGPVYDPTMNHPDLPSVTLPAPLALSSKKDAMTDTTCDITKPALPNEDFPPLEIKIADLSLDSKQSRNVAKDYIVPCEVQPRMPNVILSESASGPRSAPVETTSPSSKSHTDSDCKRPPVILMDEPMANAQVPTELTFGFEVNQQLLQCEESTCNSNPVSPQQASHSDSPHFLSESQLEEAVAYLTAAWEDAMRKLQLGRAKYYDGQ